jgi:hypothetical protein
VNFTFILDLISTSLEISSSTILYNHRCTRGEGGGVEEGGGGIKKNPPGKFSKNLLKYAIIKPKIGDPCRQKTELPTLLDFQPVCIFEHNAD